jgi:hypothetical protein
MITLHEGQSQVYEDLFIKRICDYAVDNCSRGWGKSYLAATVATTAIFELMELSEKVPNKFVYIIAPTYDQVTDIYYPLLNFDLGLEKYALNSSRDLGRFIFPGNTELRLLSYEAVERMRGKGAYFVVWDEISSCKKGIKPSEAWSSVIKPCINTRWSAKRAKIYGAKAPGRALFIGTPKGFNFFYDAYNFQEVDDRWKSYTFDYTTSPLLDPEEIERNRSMMDPIEFASEYLASFKESGNSVFYCFDRNKHVRKDLPYFEPPYGGDNGEDVHLTIDFNVGVQCTGAFALRGHQMHFLDEFKGHPDTETLAKVVTEKYKGHKIYAYPDPSGRARKTSAPVGRTDFSILTAAGINCLARQKAPPIVDSVQAVNRKLLTAKGDINMLFSTNVPGIVTSMERTKWVDNNPDIAAIDKTEGIEHYSDGVRYGTEFLFPVEAGVRKTARGFNF